MVTHTYKQQYMLTTFLKLVTINIVIENTKSAKREKMEYEIKK